MARGRARASWFGAWRLRVEGGSLLKTQGLGAKSAAHRVKTREWNVSKKGGSSVDISNSGKYGLQGAGTLRNAA